MPTPLCPIGKMAVRAIRRYTTAMNALYRWQTNHPDKPADDPKRLDLFWATQNTYLELLEVLKKVNP